MQDPIHLKHFGCWEILNKIDLMEGEYDLPMNFDESLIPDSPAAAGENMGEWGMEWLSAVQLGGILEPKRHLH